MKVSQFLVSFQSCSCKDIDALNQNINSLNNNMGTLQSNFDKLARALNVTQEQLGMKESLLTIMMLEKQNLSASLTYHQMLLNTSQVRVIYFSGK
ncbi:hypothetical protein DPMN_118081 [Dreissena polymorpha]|uniref:Uncharacterized protein n=1 Tax=Dreissena polymorpha TaxID=45954 RepID=A0A9D4GGV1_DREPO|nr:hypothetical protein DPMN_118081 [Dreissena polymorpha]